MTGRLLLYGILIGAVVTLGATAPSSATMPSSSALTGAADQLRIDEQIARRGGAAVHRGGAVRRTTVVGPRGGVARRTTAVGGRGAAVRRGAVGVGGAAAARRAAWVRPANYRWRRGGAIAAGAAIGFVTAATAAAWAGAAPGPGLCWYYTDPTRTRGFWDYCP